VPRDGNVTSIRERGEDRKILKARSLSLNSVGLHLDEEKNQEKERGLPGSPKKAI